MFETLRNAWRVPELKKRLIYVLFILVLFRMGSHIPVPFIDASGLADKFSQQGGILSFVDMMNGGALSKFSIFALGVMPYIEASIIMQLLTVAIPRLESLQKEGEDGRQKINKITRYLSLVFCVIMGYGSYALMTKFGIHASGFQVVLIILTLTAGSTFLGWLGEQITDRGIGNGMSLIIAWNILSGIPAGVGKMVGSIDTGKASIIEVILMVGILFALLVGVIVASLSERRVPVQYAAKNGGKVFNQASHIPLSLTASIVIAIIFAMSIVNFPSMIAQINTNWGYSQWVLGNDWSPWNMGTPQGMTMYVILYIVAILFFTRFYTQITFKPEEMAENIHKSAGFIPGIRPGEPTAEYLLNVLNRVAFVAGIIASIVAIVPIVLGSIGNLEGLSMSGTSLLIVISVSVDMVKTLESQLIMRNYEGFLKKN